MQIRTAAIALIFFAASTPSRAGELSRLRANIDGDVQPETIKLTTAPAREEWRSRVEVMIGTARYAAEFFSAESDLPEIRLVAIDRKQARRQLLLTTPETASCVYHLLSYTGHKLEPLLKSESQDCKAPQALGNGQVSVSTWQGFWEKEVRYRLSKDGTALAEERKSTFYVGVSGAAAKPFPLQGAECPKKSVRPGTYLRVTLYDAKADRYRVQTTDGSCGWIPAADMESLVKELPWAG